MRIYLAGLLLALVALAPAAAQEAKPMQYLGTLNIEVPKIQSDASVAYDYPIVYVRSPRKQPDGHSKWAEVGDHRTMEPGADLVILYPDGKEDHGP